MDISLIPLRVAIEMDDTDISISLTSLGPTASSAHDKQRLSAAKALLKQPNERSE